eukprot:6488053-Amphidinium_carterae.1
MGPKQVSTATLAEIISDCMTATVYQVGSLLANQTYCKRSSNPLHTKCLEDKTNTAHCEGVTVCTPALQNNVWTPRCALFTLYHTLVFQATLHHFRYLQIHHIHEPSVPERKHPLFLVLVKQRFRTLITQRALDAFAFPVFLSLCMVKIPYYSDTHVRVGATCRDQFDLREPITNPLDQNNGDLAMWQMECSFSFVQGSRARAMQSHAPCNAIHTCQEEGADTPVVCLSISAPTGIHLLLNLMVQHWTMLMKREVPTLNEQH